MLPREVTSETRRYEITSVLGKGGFGTVYRARLRGAEGFTKDVAIKLLKDDNPPDNVLQRFRDEARILGLVRDRAIVGVDPPTRLDGRWAVVMEFVDGASVRRILKRRGALPPAIALDIVAEVARALDKVWNQPGPDGEPLCLIHRDLKPGNIQVTRHGEVKVLDFGIAKAQFESREASTTTNISGTMGFIAPERFSGEESDKTDVFSLGIVLQVLLTNEKPDPKAAFSAAASERPELTDEASLYDRAMALAQRMAAFEPSERPTSREAERLCSKLAREGEQRLRDWCEDVVPDVSKLKDDDLVGVVLTETLAIGPLTTPPTSKTRVAAIAAAGGTTVLLLLGGAGVVVIALLGIGLWLALPQAETPQVVAAAPAPAVVPAPAPAPPPVAKAKAEAKAKETKTKAKKKAPNGRPTVAPAPAPAGPTRKITFTSIPADAELFIDGRRAGKTPLFNHAVPDGSHEIKLVGGGKTLKRTIKVSRRGATRYVWKAAEDKWESGF